MAHTNTVVLIGIGNIKRFLKISGYSPEEFYRFIDKIAKILVEKNKYIILLPNKGIPYEIAKKYIALGGKRVYLTVPLEDEKIGIKHLEPYMEELKNLCKNKGVSLEIINTKNWFQQDMTIATLGEIVIMCGYSLGSCLELFNALYLKRFLGMPKYVLILEEFSLGERLMSSVEKICEEDYGKDVIRYITIKDLPKYL